MYFKFFVWHKPFISSNCLGKLIPFGVGIFCISPLESRECYEIIKDSLWSASERPRSSSFLVPVGHVPRKTRHLRPANHYLTWFQYHSGWLGFFWPVWQLLYLSSNNVVCFVARSFLEQERRKRENSCMWGLKPGCIRGGTPWFILVRSCDVRISSSCNKNNYSQLSFSAQNLYSSDLLPA